MQWTAWKGGAGTSTGAGFGLKVGRRDRDLHFDRVWASVEVELPVARGFQLVEVNIAKASFWNDTCRERISAEIGRWLIHRGIAPWPHRRPPKLPVEVVGPRRFRVADVCRGDAAPAGRDVAHPQAASAPGAHADAVQIPVIAIRPKEGSDTRD